MDSLRKHKKTHLEKSHVCPICGNRYRNRNNLKAHMGKDFDLFNGFRVISRIDLQFVIPMLKLTSVASARTPTNDRKISNVISIFTPVCPEFNQHELQLKISIHR